VMNTAVDSLATLRSSCGSARPKGILPSPGSLWRASWRDKPWCSPQT